MQVGLHAFLLLAAVIFSIGLYGAISKKSTIGILISIELMAIAVSINLVAINRFATMTEMTGLYVTIFTMVTSAAEVGIGLGLFIAIFTAGRTSEVTDLEELRG